MKKHIINGHEMATLRVPKAHYKFSALRENVQPYVEIWVASDSVAGECWSLVKSDIFGSTVNGGHPLQNSRGEKVPYDGQEFLLTVPVFCLSEAGRKAAKEYEKEVSKK
jgi:hypothetical protein